MRMLAPLKDGSPGGGVSIKAVTVEVTTFCHNEPEVAGVPYGTTLPSSEVDVTLSGVSVKDSVTGTTNGLLRKSVYEPLAQTRRPSHRRIEASPRLVPEKTA